MQNIMYCKGETRNRNFTTEDDDTMEAMNEDDMYRYLGHMQAKHIKHARMKQKLGEEYLNRTKNILMTKSNGKTTIKDISTYANPVLTFGFGIVKWTPTELENLQTKMRTLLTRYRFHHPRAAKERLTLPRQICGRGLLDITRLHDKQVKLLQTYFLNKQVTSSLRAALVNADDRCTPLDLVRANANEIPTDEEYNNKVKRKWYQKALHSRHPYDLSQQYVDIAASNKRLTNVGLFAETEGFEQQYRTKSY